MRNREVGTKHVFAGGTRLVSKLVKAPNVIDLDGDGIPDDIANACSEPWGWTNGNGGQGNGQGPCNNNGNGGQNGNGGNNSTGPEVFEKDQYYYHPDHLGSSSYVTDLDGEIFQHLEYFPFGETWVEESSNTQRTPYLFTSKELDEETGLYYFGARYYDPRTSVWQSPDPVLGSYLSGAPAGGVFTPPNLALYSYVHHRPTVAHDPDGEFLNFVIGAVAGAAIDLAVQGALVATGVQDDISWTSVAVSAGSGATGVGLSSVVSRNAARVGASQVVATGATLGAETAIGVGEQVIMGEDVNVTAAAIGAVVGEGAGAAAGKVLRNADTPNLSNSCSFHGDTFVETAEGLVPISKVEVGDLVWSRNPATGQLGWKRVLAAYSNMYEETVTITIRDTKTGAEHVILSNRIHPFFVQVPVAEGPMSVSMSAMELSSEGHVYKGPIANGFWVDAGDLQPRFRLLNGDQNWSEVISVKIRKSDLEAFNLTVDETETFFVSGALNVGAVWVHNCTRILRANMAQSSLRGTDPFDGAAAHHMVARNKSPGANAVLQEHGIDVHAGENGVFLPHGAQGGYNPDGRVHHTDTYTDSYYNWVDSQFEGVASKQDALDTLGDIRDTLISGQTPWKD